jgi:hypothetical protein
MIIYQTVFLTKLAWTSLTVTQEPENIFEYYRNIIQRGDMNSFVWQFDQWYEDKSTDSWALVYQAQIPEEQYIWTQLGGTWH